MSGTYYWDYLGLDELLSCQRLVSGDDGPPARDEMLFIVVHQAFELWFKQVLWELDQVLDAMSGDFVADTDVVDCAAHLERIVEIQRVLVDQLEVLETMTSLDFLEFRDKLVPASGFQSVQFRLIENRLGLDPNRRLRISGARYTAALRDDHREALELSEDVPSLFDHVERWLERTPFLDWHGFQFWREYRTTVDALLRKERRAIEENTTLDEHTRAVQVEMAESVRESFESLFDAERYDRLRAEGKRRLSREAFLAAILISLYRHEPIFHTPFRLISTLVEIDEGFTVWRQRHALMAHRMIGARIGTGGTSGHRYLKAAADKHHVFSDLFDLATYQIPRSELPDLPAEMRAAMGFSQLEGNR